MINKIHLIGNVGKDPETRQLDQSKFSKFPLATSETYKNKAGEKVQNTEWHQIVVWSGLADVAEKYIRKGSLLYIEGKVKYRSYDDKDGVTKYVTEIIANNIQMLSSKPESKPEELKNDFDSMVEPGNDSYKDPNAF